MMIEHETGVAPLAARRTPSKLGYSKSGFVFHFLFSDSSVGAVIATRLRLSGFAEGWQSVFPLAHLLIFVLSKGRGGRVWNFVISCFLSLGMI
jgi:hypothetical protein